MLNLGKKILFLNAIDGFKLFLAATQDHLLRLVEAQESCRVSVNLQCTFNLVEYDHWTADEILR